MRYGPNVLAAKGNEADKIQDIELKLDDAGAIIVDDSTLTCPYAMTDEERNGKHVFVFNVAIE